MKLLYALFLFALSASAVYADNSEAEEPPMSLAEEYVDFLQGGGGGGGGEGGGCGAGGEGEAGDEQEGEGEEMNTAAINLGSILLKDFRSAYDKLSPEDAKKKLLDYMPNVDSNKDGFVDLDEIKSWVFAQGKQSRDSLDTLELGWASAQGAGKYSWDQMLKDLKSQGDQIAPLTEADEAKEKEKFDAADENKDGALSEKEYRSYSFPELFEHMADYLHSSTMKDFDKDNDGKVSASEYDEIMQTQEQEARGANKFKSLDTNGDGILSGDKELHNLISDYGLMGSVEEEARNFIAKADSNKDGKVSYDEAVASYEQFLSPQIEIDAPLPEGATVDQNEAKVKDEL